MKASEIPEKSKREIISCRPCGRVFEVTRFWLWQLRTAGKTPICPSCGSDQTECVDQAEVLTQSG
jgi:rRNA maturation endonuclease Nob1